MTDSDGELTPEVLETLDGVLGLNQPPPPVDIPSQSREQPAEETVAPPVQEKVPPPRPASYPSC